ncbi:hypothetical protein F383_02963 [Gossypium arboreum]|uniref:Uncharacterized protein n=1 Tax=Gossypium arboreum TaxID=29729 RepID=A0A0B0NW72_GOSAR|nr:hypothetical protein F383_02963 [Gossypium arboreum]
MSEVHESSHMK